MKSLSAVNFVFGGKFMKKIIAIIAVLCMVFSLASCKMAEDVVDSTLNVVPKSKVFEKDGFSIELTTDFISTEMSGESYSMVVSDGEISLMTIKSDLSETALADYTAKQYAEYFRDIMAQNESISPTEVKDVEGIPVFEYGSGEDSSIKAITAIYKSGGQFWVALFTIENEKYDERYSDIIGYAKTVKC